MQNLEGLLKVGEQYPIKDVDKISHPAKYSADLELRKITGKNEFVMLKQKGKYYEVVFIYNPNSY